MIEFLCPNGHRIRCQASQTGRAAKCPRCGVRFRVPEATELNIPQTGDSGSSVFRPEFFDSGVGGKWASDTAGAATKKRSFEFLCPNGHRLHGPMDLQGKPGECPDCGSRFRIPAYEEIPADEKTEEEIHLGPVNGHADSGIHRKASAPPASRPYASDQGRPEERAAASPDVFSASSGEAMASLVERLWKIHAKGTTIEIRLRSGENFAPERFLAKASRENGQGVFATNEPDATVTLVVIPWHAVDRIAIRGLKELPKELDG
jgi:hypothetical protein